MMELDITMLLEYAAIAKLKQECREVGELCEVFLKHGISVLEALDILEEMNTVLNKNYNSPGDPSNDLPPETQEPAAPSNDN